MGIANLRQLLLNTKRILSFLNCISYNLPMWEYPCTFAYYIKNMYCNETYFNLTF